MFKKIILGLIVISSLSMNLKAEDEMEEAVIWAVGSAAGTLIGYAGIESYNQLTEQSPVIDGQMTPISEIDLSGRN